MVFVPMFLLTGVARYLFVPLAEAVVVAMLASYLLSRTLVPTMAKYLLKAHAEGNEHEASASRNPLVRFQVAFEHGFENIRSAYRGLLETFINHRRIFAGGFLLACLLSFALLPWLGQDFFPSVDSGEFTLHMRAPTGTRIEETAALADRVESEIRTQVPPQELSGIIDNIGLPYSGINRPQQFGLNARCRHHGCTHAEASSYGKLCSRFETQAGAGFPGDYLLLPALGHGDADSELRPSRAD
jgi:multidrug efflux pump subunit AcrB